MLKNSQSLVIVLWFLTVLLIVINVSQGMLEFRWSHFFILPSTEVAVTKKNRHPDLSFLHAAYLLNDVYYLTKYIKHISTCLGV